MEFIAYIVTGVEHSRNSLLDPKKSKNPEKIIYRYIWEAVAQMHPPQGLSTAVTMQDAPVPSDFPPTDVPSALAVEDAGAPKVVAGRYSSRVPLVRNCNCNG